jgi:hypothetical protein
MPAPLSPLAPPLLALLRRVEQMLRAGNHDTLALLKYAYQLRAPLPRELWCDWDALLSDILAEAARDPEAEREPEPEPTA